MATLTERDQAILAHVARYRLTTRESVHALFYPARTESAAKSTLEKRLVPGGYLAKARLYPTGKTTYYYLGPEGARVLGLPPDAARSVDPQSERAKHFGRLLFCCHGPTPRPKFLVREFDAAFPGMRAEGSALAGRFPSDAYYLDVDEAGVRRLGRILVDPGGANLLRAVHTAVDHAAEALPAFLAEHRFALALVTDRAEKAARLRHDLRTTPLPGHARLRIVVEAFAALSLFSAPAPAPAAGARTADADHDAVA